MQRVLVCGASGIGRSVALKLVQRGTPVHVLARSEAKLQALAAELGPLCRTTAVDVTDGAKLASCVTEACKGEPLGGVVYAIVR